MELGKLTDSSQSSNNKRIVLSITRMTIHNGPGVRTLILFKGCPLRCVWCSTPESQNAEPELAVEPEKCTRCGECVSVCPVGAISLIEETVALDRGRCDMCGACAKVCSPQAITVLGHDMTVPQLLREVEKDAVFYKHSQGGVTLSGGEVLLQPEFTRALAQTCKEKGIGVGVDTCGHVPWSNIEQVLPYVDYFLWDVKAMDPERHRELTGVSNDLILRNARVVAERGIPLYLRLPVIPGCNDSEENFRAACEFVSTLSSAVEVSLLPLHHLGRARYAKLNRLYPMTDVPLIPDEVMRDIKRLVESYGLNCSIGG